MLFDFIKRFWLVNPYCRFVPPVAGGFTDKVVQNGLRFRPTVSPRLTIKYAQARTSGTKQTYHIEVKRGKLGVAMGLFYQDYNTSTQGYPTFEIYFTAADQLQVSARSAGAVYIFRLITNTVYRDMSKIMNIMVSFNTNAAAAADRIKIYVNRKRVTSFSVAAYPAQNSAVQGLNPSALTYSGMNIGGIRPGYFDGVIYKAQIIDGKELTPDDVGYVDPNDGHYVSKMYNGDFGNNGGYYDFRNGSMVEAFGIDWSGKSNHLTSTGFSLTNGVTYDYFNESLDNVFATLDPTYRGDYSAITTQNTFGNLRIASTTLTYKGLPSTFAIPDHGKYYFELTTDSLTSRSKLATLLLMKDELTLASSVGGTAGIYGIWAGGTIALLTGTGSTTYKTGSIPAQSVLRMCVDADNKKVYMGIDDDWYADINTLTSAPDQGGVATYDIDPAGMFVAVQVYGTINVDINFGQRPWAKTIPRGYGTLSTGNMRLTNEASNNPTGYFEARARTGLSTATSQTDYRFDPGIYWTKARNSASYGHRLANILQGAGKAIKTYLTDAEETDANGFLGFGTRSLSIGTSPSFNNLSLTYVDYAWKVGGLGSLNYDGSTVATVSASPESGTSVVKWKGTGSVMTVGHGLNKEAELILMKNLSTGAIYVYAKPVGTMYHLALNSNASRSVADATLWNNTAPTDKVFTIGTNSALNTAEADYIAFCFTSIKDYMKIGVYKANGVADGPRGYCGFKPAFLMLKKFTDATSAHWIIVDNVRNGHNALNYYLYGNLINAEVATGTNVDLNSTGFKIRTTSAEFNTSNAEYLYFAIAESALKFAMAA